MALAAAGVWGLPASGAAHVGRCAAGALALGVGPAVIPKTQQEPVLLRLVNRGSVACRLDGHPRVRLAAASGAPYPFAYRDGGDQEVSGRSAVAVTLAPRTAVWVMIDKNHCELHTSRPPPRVRWIELAPPGSVAFLRVAVRAGAPHLEYCPAPDPGHRVDISAVARSPAAAAATP